MDKHYIHGTDGKEQDRLAKLNALTNDSFIAFVNVRKTDRILELGSGLGFLAEKISENLSTGKLTGIEISKNQLAKCPKSTAQLEFIQGDIHTIPFRTKEFDKIYCRYILEHVADPLLVLKEARRVLKTGGTINIQENSILVIDFYPECPLFKELWKKFAGLQAKLGGDAMVGLKLYSLLKEAGFINISLSIAPEIHYHDSGTLLPWIDNLISNIRGAQENLIKHGFSTINKIENAIEELNSFKSNSNASCYFYWNRAMAEVGI